MPFPPLLRLQFPCFASRICAQDAPNGAQSARLMVRRCLQQKIARTGEMTVPLDAPARPADTAMQAQKSASVDGCRLGRRLDALLGSRCPDRNQTTVKTPSKQIKDLRRVACLPTGGSGWSDRDSDGGAFAFLLTSG